MPLRDDGLLAGHRRARAVAVTLRRRFEPGSRVILLHPPSLDFLAAAKLLDPSKVDLAAAFPTTFVKDLKVLP